MIVPRARLPVAQKFTGRTVGLLFLGLRPVEPDFALGSSPSNTILNSRVCCNGTGLRVAYMSEGTYPYFS